MRFFLQCSYRGDQYSGWQRQPNAGSIQQTLEEALGMLLGEDTGLTGAGRTDAGVHARFMIAHFDTRVPFEGAELIHRLNRFLPADIAVQRIDRVKDDAHARFDALSRKYEYWLVTEPDPFLSDRAYYVHSELDFDAMNQAAAYLLSHSDFECFSKSNTDVKTFICDVRRAVWERLEGHHWVFVIEADRFLRNMVRAVVGTLLEIGKGRRNPEGIKDVLRSRNRSEAGVSVPAKGLYLTDITYPQDTWL